MRIGIIAIALGFTILQSELDNIITNIIPGQWEIPLGIGLIVYGIYILGGKVKLSKWI